MSPPACAARPPSPGGKTRRGSLPAYDPTPRRDLLERLIGHLKRRVGHQHVDAPELPYSPVDHRPAVCRVGEIARHYHGAPPGLLHPLRGVASVVILVEV